MMITSSCQNTTSAALLVLARVMALRLERGDMGPNAIWALDLYTKGTGWVSEWNLSPPSSLRDLNQILPPPPISAQQSLADQIGVTNYFLGPA